MKKTMLDSFAYDGESLKFICDDNTAWSLSMTPELATKLQKTILDYQVTKKLEEQKAQRESGNVWTITFWRYHVLETEICYSEKEALETLYYGEEYENLSASGGSITYPDGTVLEGREMHDKMREACEKEEES